MITNFAICRPCVITGKPYTVFVRSEDWNDWQDRKKLAQEAFPYLSSADREFIISSISPEGWDQVFLEPLDDASDES